MKAKTPKKQSTTKKHKRAASEAFASFPQAAPVISTPVSEKTFSDNLQSLKFMSRKSVAAAAVAAANQHEQLNLDEQNIPHSLLPETPQFSMYNSTVNVPQQILLRTGLGFSNSSDTVCELALLEKRNAKNRNKKKTSSNRFFVTKKENQDEEEDDDEDDDELNEQEIRRFNNKNKKPRRTV